MEHKTYERAAGSGTAFLFLHGILGTPAHFKDLIPLVPESCSVYAPLLPGHGGSVRDFSRSSMAEWRGAVEESVAYLARSHSRIFIVAHSMGALFAIRQGVEKPQTVKGLFLLAAPLKLAVKVRAAENMANLYFDRIAKEDLPALAARDACSITLTKNIFAYLGWAPRYLELFSEIRKVRGIAGKVSVPTEVYQSAEDELVSRKASSYFAGSCAQCHILPRSRHYYYEAGDCADLFAAFDAFVKKHL